MIGAQKLRERLELRRHDMTKELCQVVSIDSPTFPGKGTNMVASHFEERYRSIGGAVERLVGTNGTGDHLLVKFEGNELDLPKLFLIGHCDTVFPEGTVAERPFSIEGDIGRGPGVVDMKGGLVTGFYAMEALLEEGFENFGSIVILYDTDEERGNPSSRPIIEELGKSAAAALILEPGRADGSLVSARMGSHYGRLTVKGIAAHAGVDPERGKSAVHEIAEQIVRIYRLVRTGGTVNVTSISGGERPHIIAEDASCFVELRAWQQSVLNHMQQEMEGLLKKPVLNGTTVSFEPLGGRPAMERTPATEKLLEKAQEIAKEAGVNFSHTRTGGGSDGNYLAPFGVPVLDGLGPVGGNLHTSEEYIELSSLVPRTAMLAGIIEWCASTPQS